MWKKKKAKSERWLKRETRGGRSRKSSKRPSESFTNSEGHQPVWHSLLCPHLCLIKHHPAPINTRLRTETQCTYIGMCRLAPTLHSAPSLDWVPEEKCKKAFHLSIPLSTLTLVTPPPNPPSPLPFIMKTQSFNLELHVRYHTRSHRWFSQKCSRRGDLECFTAAYSTLHKPQLQHGLL